MTKASPLISVIIPTHNSEETLVNCLESVIDQTFSDYEVWIIDGGSTDQTIVHLNKYSELYSNINFVSEKDGGIYEAMNKGIGKAHGKFLYFLGSDDTLFNGDVFAKVADVLNNSTGKIFYGNVTIRGTNRYVKDGYVHAGRFDLSKILSQNIAHQAIFYHHSVFKESGVYKIKYKLFADYELNLRFFARYRFEYMDLIIANFFIGGYSSTETDLLFENDKDDLVTKYFYKRFFNSAFIKNRLLVLNAAKKKSVLNRWQKIYPVTAYLKLRLQMMLFSKYN